MTVRVRRRASSTYVTDEDRSDARRGRGDWRRRCRLDNTRRIDLRWYSDDRITHYRSSAVVNGVDTAVMYAYRSIASQNHVLSYKRKPSLTNAAASRDSDVLLFVGSSVCLSPVKSVNPFARWQHLAANGGGLSYRLRCSCYLSDCVTNDGRVQRWKPASPAHNDDRK